ncbi:MAG: hypothetical protein ACE5FU_12245, partial [Nitrospinota bacterium]
MNLLPSQTDQQFKVSRTLVIEIPAFVCKFSKTRFTGYFRKTLLLLMIILSAGIATPQESPGKRLNTWEIRFENALYLYLTNHLLDASNLFTRLIPNQREKQAAKALHYSILSLS